MKFILLIIIFVSLHSFAFAESTFFDNPDDAFIIGGSTGGGTDSGTTGGGGCSTNWTCSAWNICVNGTQIRNCTKEKAYCYADLKKKPVGNQSCSIGNPENKNNTDSGEGINNYPNENESSINNLNSPSSNIKKIILGILIIVAIFTLIFFGHKRYRKRRYFHYGY